MNRQLRSRMSGQMEHKKYAHPNHNDLSLNVDCPLRARKWTVPYVAVDSATGDYHG